MTNGRAAVLGGGTVRHITGLRAVGTVLSGLALAGLGLGFLHSATSLADGWRLEILAGVGCLVAGALLTALPWRITTRFGEDTLSLGWALGRREILWAAVRRILIGPLGSGGERDPLCVTLLLSTGEEVLYASLGRRSPREHPAAQTLLAQAELRSIPVEDATAPPEEVQERARRWREARLRGWR